jgi:hypothetical protein
VGLRFQRLTKCTKGGKQIGCEDMPSPSLTNTAMLHHQLDEVMARLDNLEM